MARQRAAELRGTPTRPFDAFLSYAHEDRDTVAWLHRLLCRFWVPGKPRRNIFLDEHSLPAGPLTKNLQDALHSSRYLIVCCSLSSRGSSYVDLEIRHFLTNHPIDRVLVCLVGSAAPRRSLLPAPLADLERRKGDTLLTPNLQEFSHDLGRSQRASYRSAALSLLAPLVGLKDKGALLDRRQKVRAVAAALLLLALTALGGWVAWMHTTSYQVQAIASDCCDGEEFRAGAFGPLSAAVTSEVAAAGRWADAERIARRIREKLTRAQALTALADTCQRSGRRDQATSIALAALATARQIDDDKSRAEALLRLAACRRSAAPAQMATTVREAYQAAAAIQAPETRSIFCSRSALALLESGQAVEARRALAAALEAAGRISDSGFQARAYASAVAPVLLAEGSREADCVEAQAISAAHRIGANEERAMTLARVAIAMPASRSLAAGRTAAEAITTASKVNSRAARSLLLNDLTDLLAGAEPMESPHIRLIAEALSSARAIDSPGLRARPLAVVSAALRRTGRPQEAAEISNEAMNDLKSLKDADQQFQIVAAVATVLGEDGPSDAVRSWAERAALLATSLQEVGRPTSLMQTAAALTRVGRQAAARDLAQRALREAVSFPDQRETSALQSQMAAIEAQWGEYRRARITASRLPAEDRLKAYTMILQAFVKATRPPDGP